MFTSATDQWSTPIEFFEKLNNKYHFSTDVCADETNSKCSHFYSKEIDGLSQEWKGACWMNPPYGREIGKWVQKAYSEHVRWGATIVMLIPARTDTSYFHDYIYGKAEIRFLRGRLKFEDENGAAMNTAPFPSMVVIFR